MNSDLPSSEFPRPRAGSHGSRRDSSLRRMSTADGGLSEASGRAGSSPEIIEHEDAMPSHNPPGYENVSSGVPSAASQLDHLQEPPPDYSSPTAGREDGRSLTKSRFPAPESGNVSPDSRHGSPQRSTGPILHVRTNTNVSSSRGVGGVPQLPSLRLANLTSIQVDPRSPSVRRRNERSPR